jgi:hypothetical protein
MKTSYLHQLQYLCENLSPGDILSFKALSTEKQSVCVFHNCDEPHQQEGFSVCSPVGLRLFEKEHVFVVENIYDYTDPHFLTWIGWYARVAERSEAKPWERIIQLRDPDMKLYWIAGDALACSGDPNHVAIYVNGNRV